jgi:hypothetical protein
MAAISCADPAPGRSRKGAAGTAALLKKFPSPEARSEHFRRLGVKSQQGRVTLTGAEALAVAEAMRLLAPVMVKVTGAPRD